MRSAAREPWSNCEVNQVLGPQQQRQLAEVHLRNDHPFVATQDVAQICWERVQMPQVRVRDQPAGLAYPACRGDDRPVVEPDPSTKTRAWRPSASAGSSTVRSGMSWTTALILACRVRTISSWLAGS